MSSIVPLSKNNVAYAVSLAEELHRLGSLRDIAFDRDHMMKNAITMIDNPGWHCCLAKDDSDYYCGIVTGYITPFLFSPKLMAVESCWYVKEKTSSRTKLAVQLMRGFVQWAKDHNVVKIQTGDIAGINALAVDNLYRRIGFTRAGTIYSMELN